MKQSVTTLHFEKTSLYNNFEDYDGSIDLKVFMDSISGFYEYTKTILQLVDHGDSFTQKIQGINKGSLSTNIVIGTLNDSVFNSYKNTNKDFLSALENKNIQPLQDSDYDEGIVLEAYKYLIKCLPENNHVTDLTIKDENSSYRLSNDHKIYLDTFIKKQNIVSPGYVIGKLYAWTFPNSNVSIKYPPTKKEYSIKFDTLQLSKEEKEDLIVKYKENYVQIFGDIEYSNGGEFVSVKKLLSVYPVDLNPIILDTFVVDDQIFTFKQKQTFNVTLDQSKQLYVVDHEESGLYLYGETRESLRIALEETISIVWNDVKQENCNNLTETDKWILKNLKVVHG